MLVISLLMICVPGADVGSEAEDFSFESLLPDVNAISNGSVGTEKLQVAELGKEVESPTPSHPATTQDLHYSR